MNDSSPSGNFNNSVAMTILPMELTTETRQDDSNDMTIIGSTSFEVFSTITAMASNGICKNKTKGNDTYIECKDNEYLELLVDRVLKQLLSCFGFFINSIAIWILVTNKKMQNIFLHLLACSLVADNGFLFMELLTTLFYEFKYMSLVGIAAYVSIPFKEIFYTANLLITMSMAYERYCTIDVSGKGYRTKMTIPSFRHKRLKRYIIIFVIFSLFFNFPEFFTHYVDNASKWPMGRTKIWESSVYRNWVQVKWLGLLSVTFVILLTLNLKIFNHVAETLEKVRDHKMSMDKDLNRTVKMDDTAKRPDSKSKFLDRLKRNEKVTFALFGIVALYFFCNTFYVIEEVMKAALKKNKPEYRVNFDIISRLMRVINAVSNVLIYCVADVKFRRLLRFYLKRMFYPLFCKLIPVLEPIRIDDSETSMTSRTHVVNSRTTLGPNTPMSLRKYQSNKFDIEASKSSLKVDSSTPK